MSENNPQSWFKQLDKLFDNVETSTNKVLKEVSSALNYLDPEAPTITQKRKQTFNPKAPTTSLNNSKQEELANHSPNDSTQKNEMQSVYDKAFEDFKRMYSYSRRSQKVLNDPEENKNTITGEKQLRLEFNKRIQCLFRPDLYLYNVERYSESHNMHLRAAFSSACATSVGNRKENLEAYYSRNIDEFNLLTQQDIKSIKNFQESKGIGLNPESQYIAPATKQNHSNPEDSAKMRFISRYPTSTHALPASEKQKPVHLEPITYKSTRPTKNLTSIPPLSAFQQHKIKQHVFIKKEGQRAFIKENPQYKKAPEAECPDIFSFFEQHLKTATIFLTSATSFFDSCINPRKTPNPQSKQDSVHQKTATAPTENQTPGIKPEPTHTTKIVPFFYNRRV